MKNLLDVIPVDYLWAVVEVVVERAAKSSHRKDSVHRFAFFVCAVRVLGLEKEHQGGAC